MIATKRIIFRADGNSRIGLGHLIRSLALANMVQDDFECLFVTQEPDAGILSTFEKAGIKVIVLPKTHLYLQETAELIKIIEPSDTVVLDGYAFQTDYQQKIKDNGNNIICLDDIHAFPFVANAIINQAGGVFPDQYSIEPYTKLFLGPAYALLRKPFLLAATKTRQTTEIKNIFLNMGGADPDNQTLYLLNFVLSIPVGLIVNVVIGAAYAHQEKLHAFVKNKANIILHQNLDAEGMCRLMQTCDAAILPPSSVSYEWCSVSGLLFVHQIAENQNDMAAFLIDNELAFPVAEFEQILGHPRREDLIKQQVKRQREYFDGKSKNRLQRIFFDLVIPDIIQIRVAEASDMELLFAWANDPEVRRHSFNPAPIPLEMHQRWFNSKLNDPDCLIFIALVEKEPAGMIRYDIKDQHATISYLLDKNFRGKGFGPLILAAGTKALQQLRPDVNLLIGHVQLSNTASVKSFQKAGFMQTNDIPAAEPNSLVFVKSLN